MKNEKDKRMYRMIFTLLIMILAVLGIIAIQLSVVIGRLIDANII